MNSFLMVLDSLTWVQGIVFRDATDAIDVFGRFNVIGGERHIYSNVFLGMKQNAILLAGDSNVVLGNYIGIDTNGDTLGNEFGVFVTGSGNKIGHPDTSQANTISGNHVAGVTITGNIAGGGKDNRIVGNYIGTDPSGTQKRGNATGIEVFDAINTQIGDYLDTPQAHTETLFPGIQIRVS